MRSSWQPTAPVRIIAGTPPGGGQDRAARALADSLQPLVPSPVSVDNVPGRGGGNAWDALAAHAGDAHWLAVSSPTLITNRLTGVAELGPHDVTQLAVLVTEYIGFAVAAASSIGGPTELLARLSDPSTITVALATALGNVNHMALGQLVTSAGADPKRSTIHVFDSARHAVSDVMKHNADVAAVSAASLLPELQAGEARILATTAPNRLDEPLQEVPTWREVGVDCAIGTWRGVVAPPGIGPDAVAYWVARLNEVVGRPTWQESSRNNVWSPTYWGAEAATTFKEAEERGMRASLVSLGLLS